MLTKFFGSFAIKKYLVALVLSGGAPSPSVAAPPGAVTEAANTGVPASGGGTCSFSGHVKVEGLPDEAPPKVVVVTFERLPSSPRLKSSPLRSDPPMLWQRNFEFVPSYLVVKVGDTVSFVNEDSDFHSVFSATPSNPFEIPSSRRSVSGSNVFSRPGVAHIQCNIHSKMRAEIFVLQTNLYNVADANGNWRIDAPAGSWKVVALEPNGGRVEDTVSGCVSGFELKPLKQLPKPNLRRKDKSSYPEYSP